MTAAFGATTVGMALVAPYLGERVFDIIIRISGAFFGLLLGLFLLAALAPRANAGGAGVGLALVLPTAISPWWYPSDAAGGPGDGTVLDAVYGFVQFWRRRGRRLVGVAGLRRHPVERPDAGPRGPAATCGSSGTGVVCGKVVR
jgi:hypothetical protein